MATYLADHPATPTDDIAAGVHAKRQDVKTLLETDSRFQRVTTPPERNARAKCWSLTEQSVPDAGTDSNGLPAAQAAESPSGAPTPPEGRGGAGRTGASAHPDTPDGLER